MTWRELTAEQLYSTLKDPLLVDVRSPCESAAESIPGAINVPLLNDDERAQVGTTYVQVGEMVARRMALKLISPKIPSIVDRILTARRSGQAVVVHCWRGGLRSEAVASFLAIIGIDCWRLTGGYKSWRRYVLDQLSEVNYSFTPVVLQGLTGVGKTEILNELAKLNVPTIDLEDIANHRGSAFGGIGLNGQPTQKNFEAALWMKLRHTSSGPLVLEAESRKIGKLALPDLLVNNIAKGRQILVVGSLDTRASRIACEYSTKYADSPEVLQEALRSSRQSQSKYRQKSYRRTQKSGSDRSARGSRQTTADSVLRSALSKQNRSPRSFRLDRERR